MPKLRKHIHWYVTIFAVLLALVVWWCVPSKYAARIVVSDEYKETDLSVGLNKIQAHLRELQGGVNKGINSMDVYSLLLKTDDFAYSMAQKQVPGKGMTYGAYLGEKDTLKAIKDRINYNLSSKKQLLTIQVTDSDPLVATQMLDSVTFELQATVTNLRRKTSKAAYMSAKQEYVKAKRKYKEAVRAYTIYADSHLDAATEKVKQTISQLEKERKLAYEYCSKVQQKMTRYEMLKGRSYCSFSVLKGNEVPKESDNHPMGYVLSFVFILNLIVCGIQLFCKRRAEKVNIEWGGLFSPWVITLGVWGGMGILFVINGDLLYPLTSQFYHSISLWISIFVVTSFVTYNLLPHEEKPVPTNGVDVNMSIFYFLLVLAMLFSPLYLYKVYQIVSMFDPKDMLNNIRLLAVFGNQNMGILSYGYVISQALLLVGLWRYPKIPWWQLLIIIGCCLINSIALMEKGSIFLVVICSIYVLFERGIFKLHTIVLFGVATVVLFYFFNIAREGDSAQAAGQQESTLLDFIAMYLMSPPVAYGTVMREVTSQFGTNTFETIYLFLNRFGFDYAVHEKTQEFVYVPISTNVYTIMQPFFRDFGNMGVAFFSFLYGVVSGALYRWAKNGVVLCICLYTYMVEVLILQFYQENIFLSMVIVLQLVFFVTLMTQDKVRFVFHLQRFRG